MSYQTVTEAAAEIRAELKRHGYTSRQVSVRADSYSLGSSIDVTIKDPAVSFAKVKEAAEKHEHIRRCEVTGDILGGGNRYISVKYDRACIEVFTRRYADAVQRAVNKIEGSYLIPVEGTQFFVGRPPHQDWIISVWNETSYVAQGGNVEQVAEIIALNTLKAAA